MQSDEISDSRLAEMIAEQNRWLDAEEPLALFELSPIGVNGAPEANGRVYYFCSDHCREEFKCGLSDDAFAYGTSRDAISGTVCDECGEVL